jgi:hypothetical protein
MATQVIHEFVVTGWGTFPLDMLRYDRCWIKHEWDTPKVAESFSPRAGTKQREVTMQGMKAPTAARWDSFGWVVLSESSHKVQS